MANNRAEWKKEIQKVVQMFSSEQESAAGGGGATAAYEPVQIDKVTLGILGWIN